jgi:hypothetical protein
MKKLLMVLVIAMSGCCAYPGEAYVAADKSTYEWAAPKLKEWAKSKNDPEWDEAVDAKLTSWEARWQKAEKEGKAE